MTSGVCPALCGEQTTFGRARIGSSGASGSWWKTSRPAPRILFSLSAARGATGAPSTPRPLFARVVGGGQRLLVEDVEARAQYPLLLERGEERVAVHEHAAPRVDQDGRRLHQG